MHHFLIILLLLASGTVSGNPNIETKQDNHWRFDKEVKRQQLENGLTVIHRARTHHKRAGIALVVGVGLAHFECDVQAAPHVLEHLFFEGTDRFNAHQLRQRIKEKAGQLNGFTRMEDTGFTIDIHENYLPFAIQHLFHMMTQSNLDAEAFDRAIRAVQAERGISNNQFKKILGNKRTVLDQTISRAYQGSALECYEEADPAAVSLEILLDAKERFYQPDNMTLIVLGNITEEALNTQLADSFALLQPSSEQRDYRAALTIDKKAREPIIEYGTAVDTEAHLYMIVPTIGYNHPDAGVVELISDYLDERLYKIVRNDLGLGYTPYARYDAGIQYGHIHTYVKTTYQWIDQANTAFLEVYQELLTNGISPEALARLISKRELQIESEEKTALGWLHRYRGLRTRVPFPDVQKELRRIDAERINRVLKQHFPQQPTVGMLRPRSAENTGLHILLIMGGATLAGVILIYLKRRLARGNKSI